MMEKVSWGIIGCGNVTEAKSGPAFNKVEKSCLTAVMRRNQDLAREYAERHHVPKYYSVADDLINDPDVNAVYIATPPDSHAELAIKALQAGKPVYVEKPMALNYADCLRMIEASESARVPLFVAYYRRALPGFLKVKELIDAGAIGKIRTVNLQLYKSLTEEEKSANKPWRVSPLIAGGGHFVDLASHQLDYFDSLFGPVTEVVSLAKNQAGAYAAEDIVSASFLFENNVILTGSWCFSVPENLRRDTVEIIGEGGSIRFSTFDFLPIELETRYGMETFDFPKPLHVQQNLIQLIVNELLGEGKSPSTGLSAARTTRVIDQILEKYYR